MTEKSNANAADRPAEYQITLEGRLGRPRGEWFGDVTVTPLESGHTLLTCTVADQAALHALLRKVRDLGLPLLSVARTEAEQQEAPAPLLTSDIQSINQGVKR